MKILNISAGQDTGGQQLRTARAFRKHAADWTYTCVTQRPTFYQLENPWSGRRIRKEWWPNADVIHAHNKFRGTERFDRLEGPKPYVLHQHGTIYRTNPDLSEAKKRNAIVLVSTLDLWALHPPEETEWLPAPYDLDWLQEYREPHNGKAVRIAHAPTNRAIKSTEALQGAVQRLRSEGHDVELDLIERQSWESCLARKGRADIYFDQVLLGYGCNAVEAWGMGIPVIAGVDPERVETVKSMQPQRLNPDTLSIMRDTWGELPFYAATEDTIYESLLEMMDPEIRKQYAERGMAHVQRYHADHRVVAQLQDVYRRAKRLSMQEAA